MRPSHLILWLFFLGALQAAPAKAAPSSTALTVFTNSAPRASLANPGSNRIEATGSSNAASTNQAIRWFTNGMIISEVPFDRLAEKGVWFFENLSIPVVTNLPVEPGPLLWALAKNGDGPVLLSLAAALNLAPPTATNTNTYEDLRRRILERLAPQAPPRASFGATPLGDGGIAGATVLRRADVLESVEVTVGGHKENLIRVRGQVEALVGGVTLSASAVTLNTETRDLVAEGDVRLVSQGMTLRGDRLWINLSNQQGAFFGASGAIEGFQFKGEIFKINGPSQFSVERAQITVETNARPHFFIQVGHLINPRRDAYYVSDISFFVHNAPFFWFPFVFQDPLSTSITLATGHTAREGYYLLNSAGVRVPGLGEIAVKVNFFEKLGSYASLANAGGSAAVQYRVAMAGAMYYDNAYINDYAPTLVNTSFIGDQYSRTPRFRGKFDSTLGLNLMDPSLAAKGVSSRLEGNFYITSDPFFSDNLERSLPSLDVLSVLRDQVIEGRYVPVASDNRKLNLSYTLSAPNVSVSFGALWGYLNAENLSVLNPYDPKRWETHLSTIQLPDIQFRLSGAIDPPSTNHGKRPALNIGYAFSAGYTLIDYYNTSNFQFQFHNNTFNASVSLSRPITVTQTPGGKELKALDFSLTPSVNLNLKKVWGGEELGFDYRSANELNTRLNLVLGTGLVFNFPSASVKSLWNNSWDYRSMLPVATLGFNWAFQAYGPINESVVTPTFTNVLSHGASASFSLSQKGYGLFYVPYLDFGHQFNLGLNYDLLENLSASGGTNVSLWSPERVSSFDGNYLADLSWKNLLKLTWSLPISFFDRGTKSFLGQIRNQVWSLGFNWSPTTNRAGRLFRFGNIQATLGWSVFSELATQTQDSLTIKFAMSATLFRWLDLSFSLDSANNLYAWQYLPEKAAAFGVPSINFFDDLLDSAGFRGQEGLQRGHIKMNSVRIAATHDLESWLLSLTYEIIPVPLANTGAVRGYYFDQRVSFDINLKPEYRPKGFNTSIPAWRENFIPPVLRQQGQQTR
ncbi:MAG: LPS-assembly protein LptD [Spirochaetes bacterium]|nr:LPS-assembly protein LptD [Spirochaetota bacterium]